MLERFEQKCKVRLPSDPANQRSSPRYPFSSTAEVIDLQGNTRITGRIADIAKKGCYIDTISPFPPKTAVSLRIKKDDQTFETQGAVVYSQVGMGMGLVFTRAESEQLRMLDAWLAELRGEKIYNRDPPGAILEFKDPKIVDQESRSTLSELVLLLSRKGVLSDSEGHAILQRIFK
ncbi:MAG: PilZ domain-containing protein [Candidatus Acidiferrum sp.]